MEKRINIAQDFSVALGGRWKRIGPKSGEEFYDDILLPAYEEAKCNNEKLIICLDGTKGYPSSFLDQSFGELAREKGVQDVKKIIKFETKVFPWVVDYIKTEIWDKTK